MDRFEMIPVALARSGFEAKLLAARLGSEGVIWELRGDVDSLYPVGGIEVLVPSDEVDRARDVLDEPAEDAANELWGGPEGGAGDVVVRIGHRHRPAVVLAVLLITLTFIVVRLSAMG